MKVVGGWGLAIEGDIDEMNRFKDDLVLQTRL